MLSRRRRSVESCTNAEGSAGTCSGAGELTYGKGTTGMEERCWGDEGWRGDEERWRGGEERKRGGEWIG